MSGKSSAPAQAVRLHHAEFELSRVDEIAISKQVSTLPGLPFALPWLSNEKEARVAVLLTCKDIDLEYPTKHVLQSVTLGINVGDRIGIVGRNGDGKSTLLGVLAQTVHPDSGRVLANGSPTVGMLGQVDALSADDVVGDQLGGGSTYTWAADRSSREVVDALLGDVDLASRIGSLSGGQRRRVDLARLLVGSWDVLMLDEPTNHLDLAAINWLAGHLKHRWPAGEGALLVVTHDRWFLDEACEQMWEVHDGRVEPFEGGYSAYIMQRVERDRIAAAAEQKRQNQVRKELAWLSRGAQARRSKPRFHLEAAAALIADVPPVRNPLELKQMAMTRLGKQVIDMQHVSIARGGRTILHDVNWLIGPGERIGILGENGIGKTTLLNVMNGSLVPDEGTVRIGKTVHFASLSQSLDELAPFEDDVVRVLLGRYRASYLVDGKRMSPTALMERLGFSRDELNSRVKDLSGGQRRRLQLLLTLLEEPNVMFLDEPGNDLDTDMLAVMEDLLDSWPGTLFVVSHDRNLIERVTDDQYAVMNGNVRHVPGGVDEYLRLLADQKASLRSASRGARQKKAPSQGSADAPPSLSNAQLRQLKKQLASTERKMETQRGRLAAAQAAVEAADPFDYEQLARCQADVDQQQGALDELELAWLELGEQLESR
jgi:ATP-binding cassette subfamily F protein uup